MTAKQQRPGVRTGALESSLAATQILQDAGHNHDIGAPRCLACSRHLTNRRSIAEGFGPVCRRREESRQRTERAAALHARLWSLLRQLPDLDVGALTRLSDALDDLDTIGGTR